MGKGGGRNGGISKWGGKIKFVFFMKFWNILPNAAERKKNPLVSPLETKPTNPFPAEKVCQFPPDGQPLARAPPHRCACNGGYQNKGKKDKKYFFTKFRKLLPAKCGRRKNFALISPLQTKLPHPPTPEGQTSPPSKKNLSACPCMLPPLGVYGVWPDQRGSYGEVFKG